MTRAIQLSLAALTTSVVFFTVSLPAPCVQAAELFAYWALEETDPGDLAEDAGPNGLDGVFLSGVNPDVDGAPGFGSGAEFDGTVDGSIDLDVNNPLGEVVADFSIVAWIYPTNLTGKNRIIGSLQPNGWGFGPVNNNVLEITTFRVKDYRASVDIPENEWTHVAVTLDAEANATFYVNGEMVGTDPAGGPAAPSFDNFYIGRAASSAEYFTGVLDEVAVFEGVLEEDEVLSIMEDGVEGGGPTCSVQRAIDPVDYEEGQTVEVTLTAGAVTGAITITDTFPDGWTVTSAGGGTVNGNTIEFGLDAAGEVTYQVTPPAGVCEVVTFSGVYSGACEGNVGGAREIKCVPQLPEEGLVAYWALEEEDPDEPALDQGPLGIHGTYGPGVTPGEDGAPGFGGGALFDGTVDGSIDLGDDTRHRLGELVSDFTIVAWIYPTDLTGKNRIIGSLQPNGWGFGPVNNNVLEVTTFRVKDYGAAVDLLPEEWTHVAVVLDENADAHFYVNGKLVGTDVAGGPAYPSADNFFIGRAASSAEYFTGVIDEVAVFRGSLTEDEILDIMEEGVLPPGPAMPEFRRGDVNVDGQVNLSDGVNTLNFLFSGGDQPSCEKAADTDDDGNIAINDAVGVFNFLFSGGTDPAPPGPDMCGVDPTDDPLTCGDYPSC